MFKYFILIVSYLLFISTYLFASISTHLNNNGCIPFIKNSGEYSKKVKFYTNTFTGTVFITGNGEIVYSIPKKDKILAIYETIENPYKPDISGKHISKINFSYFKNGKNYKNNTLFNETYIGEVAKGVKLYLKAHSNNIEKIFKLKSGEFAHNIKLKLKGIEKISLNKNNELILHSSLGNISFSKPVAYQIINNKKKFVTVNYKIISKNEYGFSLKNYDKNYPVFIDPLISSTFIGSSSDDSGVAIAIDNDSNVYVAGDAYQTDFPTTSGVIPSTGVDLVGIFVSKFSSNLQLLSSALIGGDSEDYIADIKIDSQGNILLLGRTNSSNFSTLLPGQSLKGGFDMFLLKLTPNLDNILNGLIIGGNSTDTPTSFAFDLSGNIFLAGYTYSSNFPTTANAFDNSTTSSNYNGFIVKLTPDFSINASTLLGGSGDDKIYSITTDTTGNVYVAGETSSLNFPVFSNSPQQEKNSTFDAFVSKLDNSLSNLLGSTYLGGDGDDKCVSIKISPSGDIVVAGNTASSSSTMPVNNNSIQGYNAGNGDSFVAILDDNITSVKSFTFLGGTDTDEANDMIIDKSGNIYFCGRTYSPGLLFPDFAYQKQLKGNSDGIIIKLTPDIDNVTASTLLGGSNNENINSLAIDSTGNIFLTGLTFSSDFPTTSNAFSTQLNGTSDAFISKLNNSLSATSSLPVIESLNLPDNFYQGISANISATAYDNDGEIVLYYWDFGDGSVDNTTINSVSHTYNNLGTYTLTLKVYDNDGLVTTATQTIEVVQYNAPPVIDSFTASATKGASPLQVTFSVNAHDNDGSITQYKWDFDNNGTIDSTSNNNSATYTYYYSGLYVGSYICKVYVVDNNGNTAYDTIPITVYPANKVQVIDNFTASPDNGVVPFTTSFHVLTHINDGTITGIKIDYNGDGTFDDNQTFSVSSVDTYFSHQYNEAGTYHVKLSVFNANGYEVNKFITINTTSPNVYPVIDNFTADTTSGYAPLTVNFNVTAHDEDGSISLYQYDFNSDGIIDQETESNTLSHSFTSPGLYTVTVKVLDNENGATTKSITINVLNNPPVITDFSVEPNQGKMPLTVTFHIQANDSDGSITQCVFFDGINTTLNITSCEDNTFTYTYNNKGVYTPTITVYDNNGGNSKKSLTINILSDKVPPVIDNFTVSPTTGTAPLTVNFQLSAHDNDGNIVGYGWDPFGDGNINFQTTVPYFQYKYNSPGTYNVKAFVLDNDTLWTQSKTIQITVNPAPPANNPPVIDNVTFDKNSGDIPLTVNFTVNAHDNDGNIMKYYWDFNGDNNFEFTTTDNSITHTFTIGGDYNIHLKVEDNEGATTIYNGTIIIHAISSNEKPVIDNVTANPAFGDTPLTVNFTVEAHDNDGSIDHYQWDFNGDGIFDQTTTSNSTSYLYTTSGTYNVYVKVYDNSGEFTLSAPITVNVKNSPPELKFFNAHPLNGAFPLKVKFNAYGVDKNGDSITYNWDFNGDGIIDNITTTGSINHTYYKQGIYNATVTIIDSNNEAVTSYPVEIKVVPFNDIPVIDNFTVSYNNENPYMAIFKVTAHDNGNIVQYQWDFNADGVIDNITEQNIAEHIYNDNGNFQAHVTVIDNNGNKVTSDNIYVVIGENTKVPVIDSVEITPVSGNAPLTVNFKVNAHEDNGAITYYSLDPYGDGNYMYDYDNNTFSFTYTAPGIYHPKITVIDENGVSINTEKNILVNGYFNLTVDKQGNGYGNVISEPEGINCNDNCSASFSAFSKVTLHAIAQSGSTFSGWDGDCSSCGLNSTCDITLSNNKACTAFFITDSDNDGVNDLLEGISGLNNPQKITIDFSQIPSELFGLIGIPENFKNGILSIETDKGSLKIDSDFSSMPVLNIKNPDFKFPYGVFTFKIENLTNGDNATVIITLPDNATIPDNASYVKITDNNSKIFPDNLIESSNDKTTWQKGLIKGDKYLKVTLSDGGEFDKDNSANGEIVDPSGIAIANNPPVINSFSVDNKTGDAPITLTFNVNAYDNDGYILKYLWDFNGDNITDLITTAPTVSYEYTYGGTYNAKVTVVDNDNASTASNYITIQLSGELPNDNNTGSNENPPADNATEQYTLNILKGWQLIALPVNIHIDNFSMFDNITTLWSWAGNQWEIYSPNEQIATLINNYGISQVQDLYPGKGYWINSSVNFSIQFTGDKYGTEKLEINSGWNLCGIGKDITVNDLTSFNVKTVWKWTGNSWKIWSPINEIMTLINNYGIETLNDISRGEGFWVNK